MRTLVAGEGGSVLVRASTAPDVVALGCEGLAVPATVPSGIRAYPADALPSDLDVDRVELLPCEAATREAVGEWASRRRLDVEAAAVSPMAAPVRVIAVSASSTGSGKTALSRRVARSLARMGQRVTVVRHPIVNLLCWDRFAASLVRTPPELRAARPLEEREELAPLVGAGITCATGLDPEGLVRAAGRDADVIVWDGGGAAAPWIEPDLHFVAVDLLRDALIEERVAAADAVVLTKADSAPPDRARAIERRVRELNANVLLADLTIGVQDGNALRDRRVVVVEDWPSLALGGLAAGAGAVAARRFRCGVVDPRPYAVGAIKQTLAMHPHIGPVIPSLGRTPAEIADFAASVRATPGDAILWASNADPAGVVADEPRQIIRAFGELTEVAGPSLQEFLE